MATHVKVIAALFLLFGATFALIAIGSSFIAGGVAGLVTAAADEGAPIGAAIVGLAGAAITAVMLAAAVPALLCGWGLLTRRPWARILGIVLAAIAVINPPFGTLFGIYALIILFNRQTEALFAQSDRSQTTV
jgi:hypothetical protein